MTRPGSCVPAAGPVADRGADDTESQKLCLLSFSGLSGLHEKEHTSLTLLIPHAVDGSSAAGAWESHTGFDGIPD
jgi:hypothetical protein